MRRPNIDYILAHDTIATPGASGEVRWSLADHLGRIRQIADASEVVKAIIDDDAFGNPQLVTTLATDMNGDNTIDSTDFGQMPGNWAQATWMHAAGDVNRDGIIDGLDANYMIGEWGATDLAEDQLFLWVIGHTELYTGLDFDAEVWLQYNRARYYDAKVGRWISEDPIGFAAGDYNVSRYVANSPTNATDPSGLATYPLYTTTFDAILRKSGHLRLPIHPNLVNNIRGSEFEKVVGTGLGVPKNVLPFVAPSGSTTVPDFLRLSVHSGIQTTFPYVLRPRSYVSGFIEAQTGSKTIHLGYEGHQPRTQIDVLSALPINKIRIPPHHLQSNPKPTPLLRYVTTADTTLGNDIKVYALRNGVQLVHTVVYVDVCSPRSPEPEFVVTGRHVRFSSVGYHLTSEEAIAIIHANKSQFEFPER